MDTNQPAPQQAAPQQAAPQQAVPQQAVPQQAVPQQAVPQQAVPQQAVPRNTVGIRELKQNPSEIIARAANGERFDVLSNGKAVGVVIQRDAAVRSRLVSSDALTAMSRLAGARSRDRTGWARDLQAERELANDPIVDPWDTATQSAATPRTTTPDAAEA